MSGLCTIRHAWLSRPPNLQAHGPPERGREEGERQKDSGGSVREIESKLGGNWDGCRPIKTRKERRRKGVFSDGESV